MYLELKHGEGLKRSWKLRRGVRCNEAGSGILFHREPLFKTSRMTVKRFSVYHLPLSQR